MGIYRFANCSTCVHRSKSIKEDPCETCDEFSEWEPKFTVEQMTVEKHG
jgi:hypothetical protein